MTEKPVLVSSVGTELSFAVGLTDAYTDTRPRGTPTVTLPDRPEEAVRTPSGYHVVTDLPADVETVRFAVDAGDAYLPHRETVDLSTLDSDEPLVSVTLWPAPAYPFGSGVTLVRGTVEDDGGDPVAGAVVTLDGRSDEARTDGRGEFVLPLSDLAADEVVRPRGDEDDDRVGSDDRRFVEPDGSKPVVRARDPDDGATGTTQITDGLAVGATATVTVSL